MAIMIGGTRIPELNISKQIEGYKLSGFYELMSTNDTVLAKQGFNVYNGVEIKMSPATTQAMHAFITAFQNDLAQTLGLV